MSHNTGVNYSKVDGINISADVNTAGIMNNNGPEKVKDKINIVVKKKQKILTVKFIMHLSKNRILTTSEKNNKIPILVSSQLKIQLIFKTYNVDRKKKQIYKNNF